MHSQVGIEGYKKTIAEAVSLGGKIEFGGKVVEREGNFVEPTIISGLAHDSPVVLRETFAPVVYVLKTSSLDEAIGWNNEVEQGLSSSLFTQKLGNVFKVNIFPKPILEIRAPLTLIDQGPSNFEKKVNKDDIL